MSFSLFSCRAMRTSVSAGAAGMLCLPATLFAADLPPAYPDLPTYEQARARGIADYLHDWHVVLGAGALFSPEFEGSDKFAVTPFPLVSAAFGNWVVVDPSGLRVNLYETHGFGVSARAGYDLGRKEDDSDYLKGLGDIDAGGVVGATLDYRVGAFRLYSSVDQIVGGSDGLQAKVGASATQAYDRFTFEAGVSTTWADDNYMESYFGVTQAQSARSGLAVYQAGAGFKRVDLTAAVTYNVTDNWLVRGEAGVGYLLGDAADSPITQDKLQPFGTLAVGYKF